VRRCCAGFTNSTKQTERLCHPQIAQIQIYELGKQESGKGELGFQVPNSNRLWPQWLRAMQAGLVL
jgi:hypothetical protein